MSSRKTSQSVPRATVHFVKKHRSISTTHTRSGVNQRTPCSSVSRAPITTYFDAVPPLAHTQDGTSSIEVIYATDVAPQHAPITTRSLSKETINKTKPQKTNK